MTENWEKVASEHRQRLLKLAQKVKKEEKLSTVELFEAVLCITYVADQVLLQKKPSDKNQIVSNSDFLLNYAFLRYQGKTKTRACTEIAEQYNVSIQAMKERAKKVSEAQLKQYLLFFEGTKKGR